ncbi:MAG TPA: hypothetical protein VIX35_01955, partial [Vicinamibacterales bacterium]
VGYAFGPSMNCGVSVCRRAAPDVVDPPAHGTGGEELLEPGSPFSPAVMLSPKATIVIAAIVCALTTTLAVQTAVRPMASLAWHVTVVEPSGKVEPEAGRHDTVTGGVPPVSAGAANVTRSVAVPSGASAVVTPGQVRDGGPTGGGVTPVGLEHAVTTAATPASPHETRRSPRITSI